MEKISINYTIADSYTLLKLCETNSWFTEGSQKQYDKLFYANEHGCPIEEIATIIWLCSDETKHCRRDILTELKKARKAFEANLHSNLSRKYKNWEEEE